MEIFRTYTHVHVQTVWASASLDGKTATVTVGTGTADEVSHVLMAIDYSNAIDAARATKAVGALLVGLQVKPVTSIPKGAADVIYEVTP